MKKIFKNLAFVGLGVALIVPAIATPLLLANKRSSEAHIDSSIIMPTELYVNSNGQNVLASSITKQNATDFISGIPLEDLQNNVSVEDVKLPPNTPDGGSVLLTLKLSRKANPNLFRTQTYLVEGFMYESENIFKKTQLAATDLASTILPSDLTYPSIDQKEIEKYVKNIPDFKSDQAEVSVQYKNADDVKGELSLTLLYKKNTRNATIKLTVPGFKSLGVLYKEQIEKEFTKFTFTATPNAISILPSNVNTLDLLRSYVTGFENVTLENDVVQSVSNIQPNNDTGTVSFDLTLSKGEGNSKVAITKTYDVVGFKTTEMQDNDDVQAIFDSLISYKARITNAAQFEYPSVVNANNIQTYIANLPSKPTNGVTLEYTNFSSNNTNGSLSFDIKISKRKAEKIVPQSSIFGFFSNNIIGLVLKDLKDSISKRSSDDFVHRTDPRNVSSGNFRSYFNANSNNKYNIGISLEKVEFISIKANGYFRLSYRFRHANGLNRIETIDWSLGSLYLNDVYVKFETNYAWFARYQQNDISDASVNNLGFQYDGKEYYNKWSIRSLVRSTTHAWLTINNVGANIEFTKVLKQEGSSSVVNIEDVVKSSGNHRYHLVPSNLDDPYGSNLYFQQRGPTSFGNPHWAGSLKYTIYNIRKGAANSSWMNLTFDTNGKYNYMHTKTGLYINFGN